jgi:hypothetical protein
MFFSFNGPRRGRFLLTPLLPAQGHARMHLHENFLKKFEKADALQPTERMKAPVQTRLIRV